MLLDQKDCLKKLTFYRDDGQIKLISGLRYSGKTTLVQQYIKHLQKVGIPEDQILYFDGDNLKNELLNTEMIRAQILKAYYSRSRRQRLYIFFDEINGLENFEQLVDELKNICGFDLYISSSQNSEINKLRGANIGRSVLIPVYPISFNAFLSNQSLDDDKSFKESLIDYLKIGSLPILINRDYSGDPSFLKSLIYDSIIKRDVLNVEVREIPLLEEIYRKLLKRSGEPVSYHHLGQSIIGSQPGKRTVERYIKALEQANLITSIDIVDLLDNKILKSKRKYYPTVDLLNILDQEKQKESLFVQELYRLGFTVYSGKLYRKEIDFIARRRDQNFYIQFIPETNLHLETKLRSLQSLKAERKILICENPEKIEIKDETIRIIGFYDFLLRKERI